MTLQYLFYQSSSNKSFPKYGNIDIFGDTKDLPMNHIYRFIQIWLVDYQAYVFTGYCIVDEGLPEEVMIIACLEEADVNMTRINPSDPGYTGGPKTTCSMVTIADISILIDFLFITGPSLYDGGYGVGNLAPCP